MFFQTWITFSPIADLTSTYYNINAFKVNVLSLIFMVASVPFGFAASWVLDTYGLRASVSVINTQLSDMCLHGGSSQLGFDKICRKKRIIYIIINTVHAQIGQNHQTCLQFCSLNMIKSIVKLKLSG